MATWEEIRTYRELNNKFAARIGIRTTKIEEGYAEGEIDIAPEHGNAVGSVHGGCIFSLADTIGGAAASSHGARVTTISSDFHYLSPALKAVRLFAAAREIKNGKHIIVCDVEISDVSGKLIAKGTFSYFNLGGSLVPEEPETESSH